jgi:hypothetical protein
MASKRSEKIALFDSHLSSAEWLWRIVNALIIAGGGTTSALLAQGSELFKSAGTVAYVGVGLVTALLIALTLFLYQRSKLDHAQAAYFRALAVTPSSINPLAPNYADVIIRVADLFVAGAQSHEHKQFRRCKIMGPGAICLKGGNYVQTNFVNTTTIAVPPNTALFGMPALVMCTLDECELIDLTIITDQPGGASLRKAGACVVGIA